MTLTELRYLVAVARERHFGKAAESCFVSQPTLSVAIKKLEDELGLTVFERGRGEVTLTPMGAQIVSQGKTETRRSRCHHYLTPLRRARCGHTYIIRGAVRGSAADVTPVDADR